MNFNTFLLTFKTNTDWHPLNCKILLKMGKECKKKNFKSEGVMSSIFQNIKSARIRELVVLLQQSRCCAGARSFGKDESPLHSVTRPLASFKMWLASQE